MTKLKKTTEQTIKKVASKLGFAKFDIINLAIPERIDEVVNQRGIQTPYVPFGTDNLFPQFLAEIKRKSPTHRAILGQKKILSIGQEFHSENENLVRFIENVNIDESLREVYARVIDDYYCFGNCYLQIVRHKGGINLYHIDATKCRVSKDQEHVYIHPDWSQYNSTKKETGYKWRAKLVKYLKTALITRDAPFSQDWIYMVWMMTLTDFKRNYQEY